MTLIAIRVRDMAIYSAQKRPVRGGGKLIGIHHRDRHAAAAANRFRTEMPANCLIDKTNEFLSKFFTLTGHLRREDFQRHAGRSSTQYLIPGLKSTQRHGPGAVAGRSANRRPIAVCPAGPVKRYCCTGSPGPSTTQIFLAERSSRFPATAMQTSG